jgi:cytoskeleton protein RodZ
MDLKELGNLFKEERTRQGLSLEEVMDRTKISKRVLVGLEQGREEDLPHPVYAKGLIRNYARLLGLDEENLAREFAEFHPVLRAPQEVDEEIDAALSGPQEDSGRNMAGIVLAAVVVAVAGAGFWAVLTFWEPVASMFFGGSEPPVAESVSPAPSEQPPMQASEAVREAAKRSVAKREPVEKRPGAGPAGEEQGGDTPVSDDVVSDTPEQGNSLTAAVPGNAPADRDDTRDTALPAADVGEAPSETSPAPTPEVAAVPETQTLRIEAVADCWIRAVPDGGGKKDLLLKKGRSVSFEFKESIRLRLGNAGGVRFTLNGDPYPYTSESGAVATVTIP